jgi:carbonic anhydrase/acetyltransferase-like protein (isoleucine patch superfamily)
MAVYRIDNDTPRIAPTAWVADSAQVMGRVELHDNANIWFGAVLRGDTEQMTIGRASNVQDGSIVHSDFGFRPCSASA